MIDPNKLPAAAVKAAYRADPFLREQVIAAFLNALDDAAMERAYDSWSRRETHTAGGDPMRAALEAAAQEES